MDRRAEQRHFVQGWRISCANSGLQAHYDSTLARGIVRAEDILYFIFMIVGALFITVRIVETRRWRS